LFQISVHRRERAVVEITRGCDNLCKFCQAGYYTLPYRTLDYKTAAQNALTVLDNTGYSGITFTSLSISDYPFLIQLINEILPILNSRGLSINLPSLKIDKNTLPLIEALSKLKKVNLTFALESANTEIRKIIHKRLVLDELFEIVEYLFSHGWKTVKLYFMLGLPGYKEHDEIESTIKLLQKINSIGKGRKNINATLSPFVPKVHTPFELAEMAPLNYFLESVKKIKEGVPRKVSVKNHNVYSSYVEGFLARGDLSASDAIVAAYNGGCRFDSWDEHFNRDVWLSVIENHSTGKDYFSNRLDENQPWSIIQTGFSHLTKRLSKKVLSQSDLSYKRPRPLAEIDLESITKSHEDIESKYEVNTILRLIVSKERTLKYISHLDFAEVIKRALRMAHLPLCISQGFNKRDQLSFGFPLPLGISSTYEIVDCFLYVKPENEVVSSINKYLHEGSLVMQFRYLEKSKSIMALSHLTEFSIKCSSECSSYALTVLKDETISIRKKSKRSEKTVRMTEAIHSFSQTENGFTIALFNGGENTLRIDSIIAEISQRLENCTFDICKTAVYTIENSELIKLY
jgi:radical SAM-linked protein